MALKGSWLTNKQTRTHTHTGNTNCYTDAILNDWRVFFTLSKVFSVVSNSNYNNNNINDTTQHNCNLMQFYWHSTGCEKESTRRSLIKNTLADSISPSVQPSVYLSIRLSLCLVRLDKCCLQDFQYEKAAFITLTPSATKTKRPKASRPVKQITTFIITTPKQRSF